MNMVMNNDGHGNILSFNILEYGIGGREASEMSAFAKIGELTTNLTMYLRIRRLDPRFRSRINLCSRAMTLGILGLE